MEKNIYLCLERIKLYNDPLDVKYINIEIGKYRINALKFYGLIRHLIHMDANEIEKGLRKAIDEYRYNNSQFRS